DLARRQRAVRRRRDEPGGARRRRLVPSATRHRGAQRRLSALSRGGDRGPGRRHPGRPDRAGVRAVLHDQCEPRRHVLLRLVGRAQRGLNRRYSGRVRTSTSRAFTSDSIHSHASSGGGSFKNSTSNAGGTDRTMSAATPRKPRSPSWFFMSAAVRSASSTVTSSFFSLYLSIAFSSLSGSMADTLPTRVSRTTGTRARLTLRL